MNFRGHGRRADEIDVNVVSLIDVVLLLLIFFMLSTTFIRHAEIKLTLPEASAQARPGSERRIDVAVDAQGRLFVDGRALVNSQPDTLRQALRAARGDQSDTIVVVSADARASHQSVIDVLDAARALDLLHVTFATARRDERH
ncbi:MAG: ExbD/TolR family protein [Gammaproteobacteria bacterium]